MKPHPMCEHCGKQSYPGQKAAISIALKQSREAGGLRVYRCPRRNGWHLTSKRKAS